MVGKAWYIGWVWTVMAAACTSGTGEEAEPSFVFTDDELDTHDRIDAYRGEEGLGALATDELLGELAREHSEDMLSGAVPFSHDGFDGRADAMFDAGFVGAAENVAVNSGFTDPVGTAVQGWLDSPGHHENIVGDWTHAGVGIATDGEQYYFTQLFATQD